MCEKTHQLIYDRIDEIFKGFVDNNRTLFDKMGYSALIDTHRLNENNELYATNMLNEPFNVAYIGLTQWGEGHLIAFMDKSFNKIYHYYDVM